MKQMKIKKPVDCSGPYIKVESSHTVQEDDVTGELEIVKFELVFQGNLSDWLIEYLNDPVGSRLHKNLKEIFNEWFENQ